MQIIEVNSPTTAKCFLDVNAFVNKNNKNYIRPLDKEINEVFLPNTNVNYKYGNAIRWIVNDANGNTIGRIAAFITSKYINKGTSFSTGCFGFFDCINDQQVANLLFDTAKSWLVKNNCEAMDGPINFGDRDKWWGLLVEGFEKAPIYGMPYNPSYYESLFDSYGFKNYYNQHWFSMSVNDDLPAKFQERYKKFIAKPDYVCKEAELNNLDKYAKDFATVYNAAWAQHGEAKEVTVEQICKLFKTMKPVIDVRVIWFCYYKDEPIAMFINVPDVNQYLKTFNGKLGWFEKIKLFWLKSTLKNKKLTGVAFGVIPKYQALGVDSYLIQACGYNMQNKGWFDEYEMGWAGDWNPKMLNVYKSLGSTQSRRLVTYRYIFDENLHPFERHPTMEYK
jgi:hypothetical protein